jgi:hypothetical protein
MARDTTIDRAIARIAANQNGNITHAQLRQAGLGAEAIKHRARTRRLFRVHFCVYAVGRRPVAPVEHASAAVLASGPAAVLSHQAAAALWGFIKRWPPSFQVIIRKGKCHPKGITVHRYATLKRRDITRHLGVPVTKPARTLLDIAPRLKPADLTRVVNDALHTPYLTRDKLAEVIAAYPKHPGARRSSVSPPPPTAPAALASRTTSSPGATATACRDR